MRQLILTWYVWLSALSQGFVVALGEWTAELNLAPASALLFGLTVPLALRSAGGWSFPGLFALGSTLPLLALSGILALGFGALESVVGKLSRAQRLASVAAGAVFVLAGLHDTVVYWWL